jgi:hypothetical protein
MPSYKRNTNVYKHIFAGLRVDMQEQQTRSEMGFDRHFALLLFYCVSQ